MTKLKKRVLKVAAALLLLGLTLALWGFWLEPNRLVVHSKTIVLKNWPRSLDGMRVAVMSDLHAGSPSVDERKLNEVVERTNELNPDLVLILGDLMVRQRFYRRQIQPETIAAVLKGLRSHLGVYVVLGNHDWWFNGPRVQQALDEANLKTLENKITAIQWNGGEFYLWGISDLWTRPQLLHETYQRLPPQAAVIAMTHNPDIFPDIPETVVLTLAGHTHGGQVNIPFIGRPVVPSRFGQRFAAGLIQEGNKQLFVTTGIGTSILPVRFRVPPEIALLTLKSSGVQ